MSFQSKRQEVTGITVNEFPNVKRKYINQIRAMLHAWEKFSYEKAEEEYRSKYFENTRNPHISDPINFKAMVRGKIEFVGNVRGKKDPIYLKLWYQYKKLTDPTFVIPNFQDQNLIAVPQVFLSYTRTDSIKVRKIYNDLKNVGATLWFDIEDIQVGSNWSKEIRVGLEQSSLMILVISPKSMNSEYVETEFSYFMDHKPAGSVIPIVIEDNYKPFPELNRLQYISFTEQKYQDALDQLIKILKNKNIVI